MFRLAGVFFALAATVALAGCGKIDPATVPQSGLLTAEKMPYSKETGFRTSGRYKSPKPAFPQSGSLFRDAALHVDRPEGRAVTVEEAEGHILAWIREQGVVVLEETAGARNADRRETIVTYETEQTAGTVSLLIRKTSPGDKYTDGAYDIRYDMEINEKVKGLK